MSTRGENVGGTDWADGEVLYAADLNDTVNNLAWLEKVFGFDAFPGSGLRYKTGYNSITSSKNKINSSYYRPK